MNKSKTIFKDIDEYHSCQPENIRNILAQLRNTIKKAAPQATETIKYGMPAFKQNNILVYYSVHKKHIGFYPTPNPIIHFKKELETYTTSKGAIQFPIEKPLPLTLIKKIVLFRITEDKKIKTKKIQSIHDDILSYNKKQHGTEKTICELLATEIHKGLQHAENKLWHGHPVWFLDGNPIVGYSKEKRGIRLLFWSGASFDEDELTIRNGTFKDASIFYNTIKDINIKHIKRWLKKSKDIQWDYKNIVKRKGVLKKLT